MCMDVRKKCECGRHLIQFHLRDNILIPEVIINLYCPKCHGPENFDSLTMLNDNNWIIEYDMVMAKMMVVQKLMVDMEAVTPEFIFDRGYACWQEMYPGEHAEIKKERDAIIKLAKTDQKKYLETIQKWNIERINQLKAQGWRKVLRA
ncbi:MAG: hypothetical protein KKG47_08245 [Proteobacteria bacterium]|nr:hypothetical protein [Pseudomonadota bacterium]MBU1739325.1 hypothetical protein [Pseudomonadota bacterium]